MAKNSAKQAAGCEPVKLSKDEFERMRAEEEKATRLGDLALLAPILADDGSPELKKFVADLLAFIDQTSTPFEEDLKYVDRRTRYAKRFSILMCDLQSTYGGWKELTQEQRSLIRRIAGLTIAAEKMDAEQLRGRDIDASAYAVITGHLARCYDRLDEKVTAKKEKKTASERLREWATTITEETKDLVRVFTQSRAEDPQPPVNEPEPEIVEEKFVPDDELADAISRVFA